MTMVTLGRDADDVAEKLAELVLEIGGRATRADLILAGGGTPERAYRLLGQRGRGKLRHAHLWLGDERMVPADHADSNYRMVSSSLGEETGALLHRIRGELGAAAASALIEAELLAELGADPVVDLAILGVGSDGHTASLFPGDVALDATGWFTPARAGARVTATFRLLGRARQIVFVATGEAKADICKRILGGLAPELPAARLAGAHVRWLLDRAAAGSG